MTKFKSCYLQQEEQEQKNSTSSKDRDFADNDREIGERGAELRRDCGANERAMAADEQLQVRGARESKWWRSCWNGNQLDGELLYKTIKAQQERRLAASSSLGEPQVQAHRQSHLYSVPRPSGLDEWRPSSESLGADDEDEDPLSDPLYASILGTSKQLQVRRQQVAASLRQQQQQQLEQVDPADPASAQLRSLVEKCLEVQRATRRSSLVREAQVETDEGASAPTFGQSLAANSKSKFGAEANER